MNCQSFRGESLNRDWGHEELTRAGELLAHLRECPDCQASLREYDAMRQAVRLTRDELEVEPDRGFEARLIGTQSATPGSRWRPLYWGGAAAAAAIVLLVTGYELRELRPGAGPPAAPVAARSAPAVAATGVPAPPRPAATAPDLHAQFTPQEVRERTQVFANVSELFDEQAGWVAVADTKSEVGLARTPLAEDRRLLLLRLTMSRDKRPVSQADLLIVAGQTADLTVPLPDDTQLQYHIGTTAESPVRLALWVDIKSPREPGQVLGAMATHLPASPGQVIEAGELVTAAGGYELKIGFSQAMLPGSEP